SDEVKLCVAWLALLDPPDHAVADRAHVGKRSFPGGKRQVPASVVRDGGRIVQRVPIGTERALASRAAEHPFLLEPSHVSDFPEERVDDGQLWFHQLLVC